MTKRCYETLYNSREEYVDFYQIDLLMLKNYFREKIFNRNVEIILHVFEPKTINKTVLLMHGYFDHTGSLKNLINFFLEKNWRVVSYDLQGHGLSGGKRGEIEDFEEYVYMFQQVLNFCGRKSFYPNSLVAHSTGAAIVSDYLLQTKQSPFEKVIYLAPLVRAKKWRFILFASKIVPFFIRKLPRKFRVNSTDVNYLNFVQNDPLQSKVIAIAWVLALINWNKKIEVRPPSKTKLLVIQGTDDNTVDWNYNLTYIKKKFPSSTLAIVDDGKHQLFNDYLPIRNAVFKIIEAEIKK